MCLCVRGLQEVVHIEHGGEKRRFHTRVWNYTVANLTLMALGSSAPEILLSIIELLNNQMYSGTTSKLCPDTFAMPHYICPGRW